MAALAGTALGAVEQDGGPGRVGGGADAGQGGEGEGQDGAAEGLRKLGRGTGQALRLVRLAQGQMELGEVRPLEGGGRGAAGLLGEGEGAAAVPIPR